MLLNKVWIKKKSKLVWFNKLNFKRLLVIPELILIITFPLILKNFVLQKCKCDA